jgi:hypothetical protein
MEQKHNTQLANFDVTSLHVSAIATTEQMFCSSIYRRDLAATRRTLAKHYKASYYFPQLLGRKGIG